MIPNRRMEEGIDGVLVRFDKHQCNQKKFQWDKTNACQFGTMEVFRWIKICTWCMVFCNASKMGTIGVLFESIRGLNGIICLDTVKSIFILNYFYNIYIESTIFCWTVDNIQNSLTFLYIVHYFEYILLSVEGNEGKVLINSYREFITTEYFNTKTFSRFI